VAWSAWAWGRQNEFVASSVRVSLLQIVALPRDGGAGQRGRLRLERDRRAVQRQALARGRKPRDQETRGLRLDLHRARGLVPGKAGFYNISRVLPRRRLLQGLTIYQLGRNFCPQRVSRHARPWDGTGWQLEDAHTREFGPSGGVEHTGTPNGFTLPETLADFQVASVEPEEFSYGTLRRQIRKPADPRHRRSESWVDLHLKIALPVASLIMMSPRCSRRGTRSAVPPPASVSALIGFAYFILVAFTRALGQAMALPPLLAAWRRTACSRSSEATISSATTDAAQERGRGYRDPSSRGDRASR
jgi:lipopolysaccharide export LptBFGC system permease protein LptF